MLAGVQDVQSWEPGIRETSPTCIHNKNTDRQTNKGVEAPNKYKTEKKGSTRECLRGGL